MMRRGLSRHREETTMLEESTLSSMKRAVASLKHLMESIDSASGAMAAYGLNDISLDAGGLVKVDLQKFLLYLMASDGVIEDEEVSFINRLFELELTAEDWKEVIVEANIYTNDFAQNTPVSMHIAAYGDEYMRIQGGENLELVEKVIEGFTLFGKSFVGVDGDVADSEIEDLAAYIAMLKGSVGDVRRQARLRII